MFNEKIKSFRMNSLSSTRSFSSRYSIPSFIILLCSSSILFCGLLLILISLWILLKPSSSLPFHLMEPLLFTMVPASLSSGFCLVVVSCFGISAVTTEKRAVTAIVSRLTEIMSNVTLI